jgi:predicted house-cleaning noncanonical NTP pyrophosphatase (MazG superfamily)
MGASSVVITVADNLSKEEIKSAQSIIMFDINEDQEFTVLTKIGEEIKEFLESKDYLCFHKNGTIITNAKLLPD